ncbi:MerR family transcriptional regulator [Tsukamurella strandjordii]
MRIGEVSQRSGVSARMLRHYDALGLVRPSGRSVSGYREYADADLRRIFHVESLRTLGLSLKDIGRALDDPAFAPAELVDRLIAQTQEQIDVQTTLLARLRHVYAAGPDAWDDVLDVVALLNRLKAPSPGIRQQAALGAAGTAPGEALADAVLREENLNVAGALRWALPRADGDAVRVLLGGLESDDPRVRRRAVDTLIELPADDALRGALSNADPTVRAVAAIELGHRGDPAAVGELVSMILRGDGDVPAAESLDAIAAAGDDGAIVGALTDSYAAADYPVRQRLVQALAEIRGPAAAAALASLRDDPDPRIARTADYIIDRRAAEAVTDP